VLGLEITADVSRMDASGSGLFSKQATEFRYLGEIFARLGVYVDSNVFRSILLGCYERPTTLKDLVHAGLENPTGRGFGRTLTQKKFVQRLGILQGNGNRCLCNLTADVRGGEAVIFIVRHILVGLHFPRTHRINSVTAVDAILCGMSNLGVLFHRLNDFSLQKTVILCDSAL